MKNTLELNDSYLITDAGGTISVINIDKLSNFITRRIYSINSVKEGEKRGFHAHKNLSQILLCSMGQIEILLDDGNEKKSVVLDTPSKGLFIGPGIWHEMKWLYSDSVLTVVASDIYNENDYIRDYNEFLNLAKEGYWLQK